MMRVWLLALGWALIVLAAPSAPTWAQAEADDVGSRDRFVFSGWAGPQLPVWYHLPDRVDADTPVVFVLHGVRRDADRYRDEWADLARQHGFIVVVPEFSARDFPGSRGYNTGHIANADGTPRPREQWAFAAIEPLFDHIRQRFGTHAARYTIYGHSAGAQFVHRYVMFMPDARIDQAIVANAGWYTMPDAAVNYPYGVAGTLVNSRQLIAALGQPLIVLLGTTDTSTTDPNLRQTPQAKAQGPHRYARGVAFFAQGASMAARLGTPFGWRLEFVPDIDHRNGEMAKVAARLIAGPAQGDGT